MPASVEQRRHVLFRADELAPGELREVTVGGVAVVVVRTPDGDYHALRNACSHAGAKLSHGSVQAKVVGDSVGAYAFDGTWVVRCPWHGYEFDVETGRCPADPARARVKTYKITIEEGYLVAER